MKKACSRIICLAIMNVIFAILSSAHAQSLAETYGYINDTVLTFGGYESAIIEERYTNLAVLKGDEFQLTAIRATNQGEIKTFHQVCELSKAFRITTINAEHFSSLLITGKDCKLRIKFPSDSVYPQKVRDAFLHYSEISGYNLIEVPYDPDLF